MLSPTLIFGDYYLSKNKIIAIKKKYPHYRWLTFDTASESLDNIRMEAGVATFDDCPKALILENIPNRKLVREFLINLGTTCPEDTKLIIWDSNHQIKVDPKTKIFNKTWGDFIKEFKGISGSKIINNGDHLPNKNPTDSINFVISSFEKCKKEISRDVAKLVVSLVGNNRGFLLSDIEKMALTCSPVVTSEFVIANAYPSSKESALLKFAQALGTGSYENAVFAIERFIESEFNANELAVVMLRQARWQMAASHFWKSGMALKEIPQNLMRMGKFPSFIWHNPNNSYEAKKNQAEEYKTEEKMIEYLVNKNGIPRHYLKLVVPVKVKKKKRRSKKAAKEEPTTTIINKKKRPEVLPHPFVADQIVQFIFNNIVKKNKREGITDIEVREKVFNRSIKVYLFIMDKLTTIRYDTNPMQDLQEMARVLTNTQLDNF